ncbi:phage tail tape measure protein [Neisseria leonii]|uniref:Phage tail tape measure protein n=1 Tax=Neisseria leonii TaxID=2995413 RepID=A0A9X4DZJ7_9NEIS|nr:phage tail tape measure protein [Neisseria sp. 51.81]MDD9326750.1 phage tail tape measure protein [Neisseria sp. 51.81]
MSDDINLTVGVEGFDKAMGQIKQLDGAIQNVGSNPKGLRQAMQDMDELQAKVGNLAATLRNGGKAIDFRTLEPGKPVTLKGAEKASKKLRMTESAREAQEALKQLYRTMSNPEAVRLDLDTRGLDAHIKSFREYVRLINLASSNKNAAGMAYHALGKSYYGQMLDSVGEANERLNQLESQRVWRNGSIKYVKDVKAERIAAEKEAAKAGIDSDNARTQQALNNIAKVEAARINADARKYVAEVKAKSDAGADEAKKYRADADVVRSYNAVDIQEKRLQQEQLKNERVLEKAVQDRLTATHRSQLRMDEYARKQADREKREAARRADAEAKSAERRIEQAAAYNAKVGEGNAAYGRRIALLEEGIRKQTLTAKAVEQEVQYLQKVERGLANIQKEPAGKGRDRLIRDFKGKYGSDAMSEEAAVTRQRLLTSLTGEYSKNLTAAAQRVQGIESMSRVLHPIWRGMAASAGQIYLAWGNAAGLMAGLAVGSAALKSVTLGKDLGWQMELVGVAAETGSQEVNRLRDAVLELGSSGSLYGPVELASALRVLAQAGLKTQEALQMLPTTLNLSLVAEVDTENAALFLAGLRTAFSLDDDPSGELVRQAADQTAKAAAESQTSIEQMMESMKQASSESNKFGMSVSDTSAALALLARVNITGSAAGTAMKNLLTDLAGRTDRSRAALEALGISVYNAQGMVKPFSQIMRELQERFAGMTDKSKQNWMRSFLNERGMRAANVLLNTTVEEFERLSASVDRAKENLGYTALQAERLGQTAEGSFRGMKSAWQTTLATVGTESENQFKSLMQSLTSLANDGAVKETIGGITWGLMLMAQATSAVAKGLSAVYPLVGTVVAGLSAFGTAKMFGWGVEAFKAATGIKTLTFSLAGLKAALAALSAAAIASPLTSLFVTAATVAAGTYLSVKALQEKVVDVRAELKKISEVAGSVSTEVYERFNKLGIGRDIDLRLGIGVDLDKYNQMVGEAQRVSKQMVLETAKDAEGFQRNLEKIVAVTSDEMAKFAERTRKAAGETSQYELEQRVMVLDRTKSLLDNQLTKFDQYHADQKKLSRESMEVRANYERELNNIVIELMNRRTQLAVQQMRETAAEAIRQQSILGSFFDSMFDDAGQKLRDNKILTAAQSGNTEFLNESDRRIYIELMQSGDISSRGVRAARTRVEDPSEGMEHYRRLYKSMIGKDTAEMWSRRLKEDPQKSSVYLQKLLGGIQTERENAVFKTGGLSEKDERILRSVEQIAKAQLSEMKADEVKTQQDLRTRRFSAVDPDANFDPPKKEKKERTPTYTPIDVQGQIVKLKQTELDLTKQSVEVLEERMKREKAINGRASLETIQALHKASVEAIQAKYAKEREENNKAQENLQKAYEKAEKASKDMSLSEADRKRAAEDLRRLKEGTASVTVPSRQSSAVSPYNTGARGSIGKYEVGATANGLRFKNREEAMGGGRTHDATLMLAQYIQKLLGGKLERFTAFNDKYHHSERYFAKKGKRDPGIHGTGRAFDFTLSSPKMAKQLAASLRTTFKQMGFGNDIKLLDEYTKPSKGSTAPHFDVRFVTKEAADRFYNMVTKGQGLPLGSPDMPQPVSGQPYAKQMEAYDAKNELINRREIAELQAETLRNAKEEAAYRLDIVEEQHRQAVQQLEVAEAELDVRFSLGLATKQETEAAKLQLQLERMKEDSLLRQAKLRAEAGVGPNDYVRAVGEEVQNTSTKQEILARTSEAKMAEQYSWTAGWNKAYKQLVDDSLSYGKFAQDVFGSLAGGLTNAFEQMALNGKKSFSDLARAVLADLSKILFRMAMARLISSAFGALGGAAGATAGAAGAGAAGGTAFGSGPADSLFAKGGVFEEGGRLSAFASGGIVNSPTRFNFAGGRGLMGENGAEGILPLSRMANGDLGVQFAGGGAGTVVNAPVQVSVQVNSDGSTESEVTAEQGRQLGEAVRVAVIAEVTKMLRPGGLINQSVKGTA